MPNSHTKILGYGLIAIGIVLVAVEASMMMRAGARNGIDAIDQYLFMALGAAVAIGVAVLHKLFNSRYSGRSVSFQTVSRWLRGAALPEQDKLQVLAAVLGAEPHVLRFGAAAKSRVGEGASSWPGAGAKERQVIEAFLALPPKRREVVAALVKALAGEL